MADRISAGSSAARPFLLSLALIFATIALGLVVRFGRFGASPLFAKYGGSALWALMIYWLVSSLLPTWRIAYAALIAGTVATGVEFLKLYHSPALDAFRLTLAGVLLLGRVFSVQDIGAYWLAIGAGAFLDTKMRRQRAARQ